MLRWYGQGMRRPATIEDVAERAGVHAGTVSRALNERTASMVSDPTRERIRSIAQELGYVPNILARGLITDASSSIGVLVPDLTNPLFPPIVRGIESVLGPRGYTTLIANTDGNDVKERAAFDSLLARRADGFVVATGHADHDLLAEAQRRGIRVVTVNRGAPDVAFPLVTADNETGMRAVLEHLVELGHTRITHLAGPAGLMTSAARATAFRRLAPPGAHVVELNALSIAEGEEATLEILSESPRPTAIVAANDLVAIGAMRATRRLGLTCPADVSITGFNDIPLAEDLGPPLTTVRVPHFEMGAFAARLLLDWLDGERSALRNAATPTTIMLPVAFMVRGSTGAARR
ncbi:LacI family DNA-binding transcriptional regulator [Microbacterium sp. NPDC089696]|uniref:LacI family DNA-binding transcriptional regulator n=1 Tax=Microbacterium sp. NPDC089696 TaxID=3364199 RepID=UPI0037F460D8